MAKNNNDSKYGSLNGNSKGNVWSSEYDSWKESKKTTFRTGMFSTSGDVASTSTSSSNSASSSSSSSNTLDWDKAVNDVFKERKNKK